MEKEGAIFLDGDWRFEGQQPARVSEYPGGSTTAPHGIVIDSSIFIPFQYSSEKIDNL